METIRTLAIIAALGLLYNGYVSGKSTPVPDDHPNGPVDPDDPVPGPGRTIQIVTPPDERVPPPPANPQVLAASQPIRALLAGNAKDAIKIGRTFVGWSELIAKSSAIKTTAEFQKTLQEATGVLLSRHQMAGRYALTAPINATIQASFAAAGLADPTGLQSTNWTPAASQAASQSFDAIAYQAYMAFADAAIKMGPGDHAFAPEAPVEPPPHDGSGE